MFLGSLRRSVVQRGYCNMNANPEETMENFQVETKKALWHVYDMLKSTNSSDVHISQLKVITSNIGRLLGFDSSESLLDRDGMTSMDFETYFDIMRTDLILKQKTDSDCTLKPLGERLSDVIKTCWTFCRYERTHKSKALGSDHCLVLWRLFNFFCEHTVDGQIAIPIVIHRDEAAFICKEFIEATGQKNKEKAVCEITNISDDESEYLKFGEFQNLFEKYFLEGLSPSAVTFGLNQLYEKIILEVLAKGMMWKRGFNVKHWKERYLVLTAKDLKYYASQSQKALKGTVVFDKDCEIEVPPERPAHKPNRFILHTPKKPYEMSASDLKTKHEWVSAFQTAIGRVGKETNIYQEATKQRCLARLEKKKQLEEDARRRRAEAELLEAREKELDEAKRKQLEDEELLRARLGELEEEKQRRAEAEARAREEQLLREQEQERLRELEAIKQELERLLAEERQAKRDEEIVRNLQAKLLEEEFQKREELERLKQQQEDMLRAEREQKAVLQSDREEQERLLREAKEKLEQLERDKAAAADKMQEAAEKLQKAEKDRRIMEDKVKLWKTPVGLARPIVPTVDPHVTHRGKGAFCKWDFMKKSQDETPKIDVNGDNDAINGKNITDNESSTSAHDNGESEEKSITQSKSAEDKDTSYANSEPYETAQDDDSLKDTEDTEKSVSSGNQEDLKDNFDQTKTEIEAEVKENTLGLSDNKETEGQMRSCIDSGVDIDNGESERSSSTTISQDGSQEVSQSEEHSQIEGSEKISEQDAANKKHLEENANTNQIQSESIHDIDKHDLESFETEERHFDIKDTRKDDNEVLLKSDTDNVGLTDTSSDPTATEETEMQKNVADVESNTNSYSGNEELSCSKDAKNDDIIPAYDNPIYDM